MGIASDASGSPIPARVHGLRPLLALLLVLQMCVREGEEEEGLHVALCSLLPGESDELLEMHTYRIRC
jgi:hypothetical protein